MRKNVYAAVLIYDGKECTATSVKNMHKKEILRYHVLKALRKTIAMNKISKR